MYLDAKRLQFRTRSLDLARASSSSKWGKNNEDLNFGCTAKGNIVGSINVNFVIGITYNKTVVLGKHYKKYNNITKNGTNNKRCNERGFGNSIDLNPKKILVDGCPQQNSKLARKALDI